MSGDNRATAHREIDVMRSNVIAVLAVLLLSAVYALGLAACAAPSTSAAESAGGVAADAPAAAYAAPAPAEPPATEPPAADGWLAGAHAPPATAAAPAASPAAAPLRPGSSFQAEAATYIHYYRTIGLTPEQEAVKEAALAKIPAPCCSENTLATCCCPCNMAKAAWGLSAYLIVHEGYDAPRLERTMREWLAGINPGGFRGDACYNGGCARPVHKDGCGGMHEDNVL